MAGIRRNIASVEPAERASLRDALIEINQRFFPGNRTDPIPGGVSWWFKQDEIHQATHVHGGPEFIPWHRELVNRLEEMVRQINPQLSLHYWDWTQDPINIPNANLGGGNIGSLDLFANDFMGNRTGSIGEPWLSAGYYVPGATPHRDSSNNPADPPRDVFRGTVFGSPATQAQDANVLNAGDYAVMRGRLESVHNAMHGFVNMGGQHTSFRDPFVFLLHSNMDRLFARWQTDPLNPERLVADTVYGTESGDTGLNSNIRPWSGVPPTTRPWAPPENQQVTKNYKHPTIVNPPRYDTNHLDTVGVGRLEVFARGLNHGLWHIWQTSPNNGWGNWASAGGRIDLMAVARNADGRLEVFARGLDHALWHKWQTAPNNGWSNWASLGGRIDLLHVSQNEDGRLEVFARGLDSALWHIWQTSPNNGWSGWASRGGRIDLLAVGQNEDGRLEVFARGMDSALWHIWQTSPNNGWSSWASRGGLIDLLAVGQNEDGRLEVFARGMDRALWHIWQTSRDNGWSSWASRGGRIDRLAVGQNEDRRLEVFARGTDGALWHIWQTSPNNGWSRWASRGGWIDLLEVSNNADGRLEVFVRGGNKALYHIWQTSPNNGWSSWASRGGRIDLLAVGQNAL